MRKSTFVILCLEGALLSFNVAAASALVPSIARDFALSQFFVGKIIWLYMLPYGIAALFYGPLARVIDARIIELTCIFFFSLANLLVGLSRNIYTLFVARFLMGVFGASVIPLALISISQQVSSLNRGKLAGLFFSTTFIASLLGLFLSGILTWRIIFFIPAIWGLILFVTMYLYLPSFKTKGCGFQINYLSALKDKTIISIFTYIFFISLFYHSIQQWLGVYFSSRFNLNQFLISILITLTSLSGVFGEAWGGWMSDKFGRIRIANLGTVLMILSAFLLMPKTHFFILATIMIIWGLGWTFNHASVSTILTDLPGDFLNEAASLNSSVRFISGGLGVALAGLLMRKNFYLGFTVLGICLLGLLFLSKKLSIK